MMVAGISLAAMRSKRVWLITALRSFHHQGAGCGMRPGAEAVAEEGDDLFLQILAADAPAAGAGEAQHAVPQPAKTQEAGRLPQA